MENLTKCEFCQNGKFKSLYHLKDKEVDIGETYSLVKCKRCGLIFINPQPGQKELSKHYGGGYYSLKKVVEKNRSRKVRLRIKLYNLYYNKKVKNFFKKLFFFPIKNYLRGTIIKPGIKVLDVGSGSGQFLYEMKQLGLEVQGVEPGNFDKKSMKKYHLNIKNKELLREKYPNDSFDLITMNHVLEHVKNPLETISELYRILKKGGTLILAVPNTSSLAHKIFKNNWYQLDVPRHLFDFNEKIILRELKKNGFKIDLLKYNSRPSQISKSLNNFLNKKMGKKSLLLLDLLLLPFSWIVNFLKIGDQFEVWGRK